MPETNLRGGVAAFPGGLREVGERTWAWIQPDGGLGEANAGLVVGDGSAAIVDTTWDRRQARRMLDAMAPHLDGNPVELAINTHSDGDHWWGNGELPPGIRIVTSEPSLAAIREEPPPGELARSKRLSSALSRLPGRPGRLGAYLSERLAPFGFAGNATREPTEAFSGRGSETVGGRELELIEVGPAHTAGDLVVHVPDASVVFAADVLFVGVTPIMWHGPVANWIAATELLLSLDASVYVPGHGPVAGRPAVETMRDYFRWIDAELTRRAGDGAPAYELTAAMLASPEARPYLGWRDPERLYVTVATELRRRAGDGPMQPNLVNRTRAFDAMVRLRATLA
ncbi:MBL fold metallo-hydrolase [Thermoleophilia bacterium SCSIO 60948]|nr:MBL fold metallo-hydrolase [Thermoleophilia bacterium SCSIO 60948]